MPEVKNLLNSRFREYQITRTLGEGADGIVYAAQGPDGEVALKLFFPDILASNGVDEGLRRLELQMQLKGPRAHPNLVQIIDGGFCEDLQTLYVVMELVTGASLDKVAADIPREAIPALLTQLASAAEFLSSMDLIHRDIKPANIIISDDFSTLTLLDLGVVLTIPTEDDPRLSGDKFVATTRYSPPEFVWRTEDSEDKNAWNAITFYQIGATLHDIIMRKIIFSGSDQPHAKLYDSVKYLSPSVDASDCEQWIISLAKCCLVKNWRDRIQLVSWESFRGPITSQTEIEHQQRAIRLKQIRNQEKRAMEEAQKTRPPTDDRIHQLWQLQGSVFMEIRQYLLGISIFPPRFSALQDTQSESSYIIKFIFEPQPQFGFEEQLTVAIVMSISSQFEQATTMTISAFTKSNIGLFEGKWNEMLTVESAVKIIQSCLLNIADQMIPD